MSAIKKLISATRANLYNTLEKQANEAGDEYAALQAKVTELEKQLRIAVRISPRNDKESFDWAVLGRISDLEDALELCVMFLTNVSTINEEKQVELVKHLRDAGRVDLADAVAVAGFASVLGEE